MRGTIEFKAGGIVSHAGREYVICKILDLQQVVGRDHDGNYQVLNTEALQSPQVATASAEDLFGVDQIRWTEAEKAFDALRPLLAAKGQGTVAAKLAAATAAGVHLATVYRRLERWSSQGTLSALLPNRPDGGRGKSRLSPAVEKTLLEVIAEIYMQKQRPTAERACQEVRRRCKALGLHAPHDNTVRARLHTISAKKRAQARIGREASHKYDPHPDHFPSAEWPLAVWQLDHTLLDIIVVDEVDREPIGRPWFTAAIDVCSRVIPGYYVSLDPPGATGTGQCLLQAVLPKTAWLAGRTIKAEWPCWGLPDCIHIDNAREFRGEMLRRACSEYGIDLQWRPVKTPWYGGHIERLMGSVATEIHALPGTTFSNPQQRLNYDSAGKATMTLPELETWLTNWICGVYHQRIHTTLKTSPQKAYEQGLLGTRGKPGRGLPRKVADEERLRMNLLPFELRTIQSYGVQLDGIRYYDDVLRPFIHHREEDRTAAKTEYLFRRDFRDLSKIYFYHPELKTYHPVPYRDTWRPPVSIWELRAANRKLKEEGQKHINEQAIFEAVETLREIEYQAGKLTMRVRRQRQRQQTHRNLAVHDPAPPATPEESEEKPSAAEAVANPGTTPCIEVPPPRRRTISPYETEEIR